MGQAIHITHQDGNTSGTDVSEICNSCMALSHDFLLHIIGIPNEAKSIGNCIGDTVSLRKDIGMNLWAPAR